MAFPSVSGEEHFVAVTHIYIYTQHLYMSVVYIYGNVCMNGEVCTYVCGGASNLFGTSKCTALFKVN